MFRVFPKKVKKREKINKIVVLVYGNLKTINAKCLKKKIYIVCYKFLENEKRKMKNKC